MTTFSLREIARTLGGDVAGGQVLAPAPGHSPRDRSMTVQLSANAPDGFMVYPHAGDDWRACKDHVRERLGLVREMADKGERVKGGDRKSQSQAVTVKLADLGVSKTRSALALWREAVDPRGTLAERYLASRRLTIDDDAYEALRWHPGVGAILALFRNIATGEPQALSRTFINADAQKVGRKFLGPVGGAAIMLDPFDAVTAGLHIGEGIETAMSARMLGLRPTWALGSASAVAGFPVLGGVECLSLLVELDSGASDRATASCADRWNAAGREVVIISPTAGKDLNDCLAAGA